MPIEQKRIETGIYYSRWEGAVTLEDIIEKRRSLAQMPVDNNETSFIVIYSISPNVSIPFGLSTLRELIRSTKDINFDHVVFIEDSSARRLIFSTYHSMFKGFGDNIYYAKDLDSAIIKAREILEKL